jgi:hypothetical protein
LIDFLKPTNHPPWLKKKKALQAKGVRQFKNFHPEDERNLHQDGLHDEPILPKQVTKGILELLMFHQMIKVLIHKPIMMFLLIRLYLD